DLRPGTFPGPSNIISTLGLRVTRKTYNALIYKMLYIIDFYYGCDRLPLRARARCDTSAAVHRPPRLPPLPHSRNVSAPAWESGYAYRTDGSTRDGCHPLRCRTRRKQEN